MNQSRPFRRVLQFALLVATISGYAQYLPVNGTGKCEVAEIVIADSISSARLFSNGKTWLHSLVEDGTLTEIKHDSIEGRSSCDVEIPIYTQTGVFKKVTGAIRYHINLETKDGKYRYSFSNFVYYYFAQNRNYKMVKTGKTKPLEEPRATGWQKLWTQHRLTISQLVTHQVETLKSKIREQPSTGAKQSEKKVEW